MKVRVPVHCSGHNRKVLLYVLVCMALVCNVQHALDNLQFHKLVHLHIRFHLFDKLFEVGILKGMKILGEFGE